ncbi:MAG: ABC transporter ATP-binding protein [Metamycoplasmataceae bacterium]
MPNSSVKKIPIKKNILFIWTYMKNYKIESILIFLFTLILTMILAGGIIGQYFFMKSLQEASISQSETIAYTIGLICGYVFQLILFLFQTIIMTKVAQKVGKKIREDLYLKLLKLKLSYFDSNPSGDVMSKLTNDVNNITDSLTQNVTQLMTNFFQMFWMLIVMFLFSPILSLIVLVFAPLQLLFIIWMTKKSQPLFFAKQQILGDLNGYVEETISGQKVINNFDKVKQTIDIFQIKNEKIKDIDNKSTIYAGITSPWILFTSGLTLTSIIMIAIGISGTNFELGGIISTLDKDGKLDPLLLFSLLYAFTLMNRNFSNPMFQIFQMLSVMQGALAGAERVFSIFTEKNENKEEETIDVKNLQGNVEIKNLTFSYDGKKDVLKNINISAKSGQTIGIVGPTGSGKTTIINLLTKFYDIENGDILIDGISVKNMTKNSLREEVSIVLQDTYIFGKSIYENIRYAEPNASDKEIENACIMANADHFIRSLKDGYNTVLENNAEELSQGEKQLLAIARAILKKASILILDEATSSIDTKTEKDIREGMIFAAKNKTTFMIAHRLSTIRHADQIIVLKDGEIIENGNHEQLIKNKGFYHNLYTSGINTPEDFN